MPNIVVLYRDEYQGQSHWKLGRCGIHIEVALRTLEREEGISAMDDPFSVLKLTVEEKETNYNICFCPPCQFKSQSVDPFSSPGMALDIHGVASLGEMDEKSRKTTPRNERRRHARTPNERNLIPIKCKHWESQPTMISKPFSTTCQHEWYCPKMSKTTYPNIWLIF